MPTLDKTQTIMLLLDGAQLVEQQVASIEKQVAGGHVRNAHANEEKGILQLVQEIESYEKRFQPSSLLFVFSDPAHFRRRLFPSYKTYDEITTDSLLYKGLTANLKKHYPWRFLPQLEAADAMGVLATQPHSDAPATVIISTNPDLKCVPALIWNPQTDGESSPQRISEMEADCYFYCRVLSGDPADNFEGCPEMNFQDAQHLLNHCIEDKEGYEKDSGEWHLTVWKKVLGAFLDTRVSEEDALLQARLARVCRQEDYDMSRMEVMLWNPPE